MNNIIIGVGVGILVLVVLLFVYLKMKDSGADAPIVVLPPDVPVPDVPAAPTIAITPANNAFQISMCGTCSGPEKPYGGDVNGAVPVGAYTPLGLAAALQEQMNNVTGAATGLGNEWSVSFNEATKAFSFLSNSKRAWTFKSFPNSIYSTVGISAYVDNYWVFWNGRPDISTAIGTPVNI